MNLWWVRWYWWRPFKKSVILAISSLQITCKQADSASTHRGLGGGGVHGNPPVSTAWLNELPYTVHTLRSFQQFGAPHMYMWRSNRELTAFTYRVLHYKSSFTLEKNITLEGNAMQCNAIQCYAIQYVWKREYFKCKKTFIPGVCWRLEKDFTFLFLFFTCADIDSHAFPV